MRGCLCAQVKGIARTRAKRTQAAGGEKDSQVPLLVGLNAAVAPQEGFRAGGKWTMTRFIGRCLEKSPKDPCPVILVLHALYLCTIAMLSGDSAHPQLSDVVAADDGVP